MQFDDDLPELSISRDRRRRRVHPNTDAEKENSKGAPNHRNYDDHRLKQTSSEMQEYASRQQHSLAEFLKAASKTSQSSFWQKRRALAECVVTASLSSPSHITVGHILMQENESDLIISCRALIKEAKGEKGIRIVECLTVALHGLRALACLQRRQGTVAKLLYHTIVSAEETTRKDSNDDIRHSAFSLTLAAFEALSHVLEDSVVSVSNGSTRFKFVASPFKVAEGKILTPFPIPRKTNRAESSGGLSGEDAFTISIQSVLAIARLTSFLPKKDNFHGLVTCLYTNLQHSKVALAHVALHLLQDLSMSWVPCLVIETGWKVEVRDVESFCKSLHRALWDMASRFDKIGATQSLATRRLSVYALLGYDEQRKTVSDMHGVLRKRHFQLACSYAIRASVSHFQKTGQDGLIMDFHKRVGTCLDAFAPNDSIDYNEYCAYRALHLLSSVPSVCSNAQCMFRHIPYQYIHSDCSMKQGSYSNEKMALLFLAIDVRERIRRRDVDEESSCLVAGNAVITQFRSSGICGSKKDEMDIRWMKLCMSVSLHVTLFEATEKGQNIHNTRSFRQLLDLAALILSKCIGPLLQKVCLCGEAETGKRDRMWDFMAQCFFRAASTFDILFETDRIEIAREQEANQAISLLLDSVVDLEAVPTLCVENIIKFLLRMGKRRFAKGNQTGAIMPLLQSLRLSQRLVPIAGSPTEEVRLSNRWAYVAAMYRALDLHSEAILATAAAIRFSSLESCSCAGGNQCACFFTLFQFIGAGTGDVIDVSSNPIASSDERRGLVSRLFDLTSKRGRTHHTPRNAAPNDLTPDSTVGLLLSAGSGTGVEDLFEHRSGRVLDLVGVLEATTEGGALAFSGGAQRSCLLTENVKVVVEAMLELSASYDNRAASFHDLKGLYGLGRAYLQNLDTPGEAADQTILAIYDIFAAVASLSCCEELSLDGWNVELASPTMKLGEEASLLLHHATELISKAVESLNHASPGHSDWNMLARSIRPAIDLFQLRVGFLGGHEDSGVRMDAVLQSLEFTIREKDTIQKYSEASLQSCLSVLAQLSSFLSFDGESLYALRAAAGCKVLSASTSDGAHSWFEAEAMSLLAEGTVVVDFDDFENIRSEPDLAAIESVVSRLRLAVLQSFDSFHFDVLGGDLAKILRRVENTKPAFIAGWCRTTALLALADVAENKGKPEGALGYFRMCFKECGKLLSSIRKKSSRHSDKHRADVSWWKFAEKSISIRARERQIVCLERLSTLHSKLGDHRKALEYGLSSLKSAGVNWLPTGGSRPKFDEMLAFSQNSPCTRSLDMRLRRLVLLQRARTSPLEHVQACFSEDRDSPQLSLVEFPKWREGCWVDRELQGLTDLLECQQVLDWQLTGELGTHRKRLPSNVSEDASRFNVSSEFNSIVNQAFRVDSIHIGNTFPALLLRAASSDTLGFLRNDHISTELRVGTLQSLRDGASSPQVSCFDRAHALYVLGLISLVDARKEGALARLWDPIDDDADYENEGSLLRARKHFSEALDLVGSPCDLLTRNIQRSLALVTGPKGDKTLSKRSASCLINASIGSGAREHVLRKIASDDLDQSACATSCLSHDYILRALDWGCDDCEALDVFFDELSARAPADWRYVAAALCPTGEMLLTSIDNDGAGSWRMTTTCVFQDRGSQADSPTSLYDAFVGPLDSLVDESQRQLDGGISSAVNPNDNDSKRRWWEKRNLLDQKIHDIVLSLQDRLLLVPHGMSVLAGNGIAPTERLTVPCDNLAFKFEAARQDEDRSNIEGYPAIETMLVAELREELLSHGLKMKVLRKMRKAVLVERLREERERTSDNSQSSHVEVKQRCTFLTLDEDLQRFPFEAMPCFKDCTVCRLPSLPFALLKLQELGMTRDEIPQVDAAATSYLLDPESNLGGTRDRLIPVLESCSTQHDCEWSGVVGMPPCQRFMETALTAVKSVFLYFGHGNGQSYFARSDIENARRIQAAVILMGCSSARLESVNRKGSNSLHQMPLYYEPEGIALSYFLAGATCVVGNLWDVTDIDIDRFTIRMLNGFYQSDDKISIGQCVAEARSACKLQFVVGAAPVCYGLPVCRT